MPAVSRPDDQKRNFRLGVANGFLYLTAETILDPTLVMVAFLSHLTNAPLLLGLVLPIRDGAWSLPQLWISGYLQSVPRKIAFYRLISIFRVAIWLILTLIIFFIQEKQTLLILFFFVFVLSSFVGGLAGLPFMEVVSKTIPAERRGEFFAWRLGLGGLGSLVASSFVRMLLDPAGPVGFPYNYGILSAVFLVLGTISVGTFSAIREPEEERTQPRQPFTAQLGRAVQETRRNTSFRRFLWMQTLLILAGSANPFFAVYVQQKLGGSPAMIGVYLAVLTATNLLANAYFGWRSRRSGNNRVMTGGVGAGMAMSGLMLALVLLAGPLRISPEAASIWLIPVFIFSGIRGSALGVATNSLMLDIAPAEERSLYVGFTNTVLGGVLLLTGLIGSVVELFGFPAVFALTFAAHAVGIWIGRQIHR